MTIASTCSDAQIVFFFGLAILAALAASHSRHLGHHVGGRRLVVALLGGGLLGLAGARAWAAWQLTRAEGLDGLTALSTAGFSSLGGILAAALGLALATRVLRSGRALLDDAVAPGLVSLAILRLGCFLSGCCYGTITHVPWGVQYGPGFDAYERHLFEGHTHLSAAASLPVHPLPIYESLLLLGLLVAVVGIRRHSTRVPGALFAWTVITYCLYRAGVAAWLSPFQSTVAPMAWFLAGPAAALLALSLSKSSAAEQTATPFSTAAGLLETLELQLENPRIRLAALATLLLAILKVQQPVLAQSEAAADAASPATAPTTASADSSWESGHAVSLRGGFGRAPTLCSGTSRYNGGMAAYDYVRRNQNGTEVAFGAQVDGAAHREHSESSEDQPADNGVDQTIARLSPRFRVSTPVVSLEVAVPLVTASTSGVAVIQDSEELAYTRAHLRVGRQERVFAELGVNHITPEQFEVPLLTALQVGGGLDVSRFINAPTGTVLRAGVYGFPEGLDVGPYVAVKVPLKRAGWSLEPSAFFVTSEWWNASIGLTFEPVWTERATR